MNGWDLLILLLVAGMVALSLRAMRKGKAGSCHGCPGNCAACHKDCKR